MNRESTTPALALVFPGGGVQYAGMGKKLYEQHAVARETFQQAEDILGEPLRQWCFGSDTDALAEMRKSLLAIFTCGVAAYRVYAQDPVLPPRYLAGHSQGELTALACAGVLSFGDALLLVHERGQLLEEAGRDDSTMMAISKVEEPLIREHCAAINARHEGSVYISAYNSPRQHVVSGRKRSILLLQERMQGLGAEAVLLNIRTPSHCPLMHEAAEKLRRQAARFRFGPAALPVIANLSGAPHAGAEPWPDLLAQHMTRPVMWQKSAAYLFDQGVDLVLDMGPQSILKQLTHHLDPRVAAYAFDVEPDLAALRQRVDDRGRRAETFVKKCLVIAAATRNDNPDARDFLAAAAGPYRQLKELLDGLRGKPGGEAPVAEAYGLTCRILAAKRVPDAETQRRMHKAMADAGVSTPLHA